MPDKIYTAFETALVFADSAQTPTKNLTLTALGINAARISARHDLGTTSHATRFEWRAIFQLATAGTIGEAIKLYISSSDGTNPDGEGGTADAALTVDKLRNMDPMGAVIVDTTSVDVDITASGIITIKSRWFSVAVHNDTTDALRTSTTVHSVTLTPVPDEVQTP